MMGVDLGQRRIGLAVSAASPTLARPLKTIERARSDEEAVEALRAAIKVTNAEAGAEDAIGCLEIGLPTRLDSTANEQTAPVRKMVELLSVRLEVPIVRQD